VRRGTLRPGREQRNAVFEDIPKGESILSNITVSGQGRALPFTGLAALPLLLIGLVLSIAGGLTALFGPNRKASTPSD
jgi:hypothetical protein